MVGRLYSTRWYDWTSEAVGHSRLRWRDDAAASPQSSRGKTSADQRGQSCSPVLVDVAHVRGEFLHPASVPRLEAFNTKALPVYPESAPVASVWRPTSAGYRGCRL